jgi:hypothetical protein
MASIQAIARELGRSVVDLQRELKAGSPKLKWQMRQAATKLDATEGAKDALRPIPVGDATFTAGQRVQFHDPHKRTDMTGTIIGLAPRTNPSDFKGVWLVKSDAGGEVRVHEDRMAPAGAKDAVRRQKLHRALDARSFAPGNKVTSLAKGGAGVVRQLNGAKVLLEKPMHGRFTWDPAELEHAGAANDSGLTYGLSNVCLRCNGTGKTMIAGQNRVCPSCEGSGKSKTTYKTYGSATRLIRDDAKRQRLHRALDAVLDGRRR